MTNNIFVGNLSFKATKEQVRELFEKYGTVVGVAIVEKKKGKPRGFAFVDMPKEEEKNAAIAALEGQEFLGRPLHVSQLIPKAPKLPKAFKKSYEDTRDQEYQPRRADDRGRSSKPYGKPQGEYKPYRHDSRNSKPYEKPKGEYKPRRDDDRDSRPWGKSKRASQGSNTNSSAPKKSYGKSSAPSPFKKFHGASSKPNLKSGYGTKSWPKKLG